MESVILRHANDPRFIEVVQDESNRNRIFSYPEEAQEWMEENANPGECYSVFEID